MPTIPSIGGSRQLSALPGPVLDRNQRPTVDNREVRSAIATVGKSTEMPDVPMSLGNNSLGAVGAAISEAGSTIGAIATLHQRNKDKIAVNEADTRMEAAILDFQNEQAKNPDPSAWVGLYDQQSKRAQEEIFKKEMSPQARQEVELRWNRFNTMAGKRVAGAAINETSRKAAEINKDGIELAIRTQDKARLETEIADGVKNLRFDETQGKIYKGMFEEEGVRLKNKAEDEAFKGATNETILLARAGGQKAALERIESMPVDEKQKEQLRAEARRASSQVSGDLVDDIVTSIIEGDIKTPAGIDAAVGEDNPHLNAETLSKLKNYILQRDEQAEAQDRETNGVRNAVQLRKEAQSYDPKKDATDEQYLTARANIIRQVPAGLRDGVLQILENKHSGKPIPLRPEVDQYVDRTMDSVFDPVTGVLKYQRKEPVKGPDGKDRIDTVEFSPTNREKAFEAEAIVRRGLDEWAKANPEKAKDVMQVKKKLGELMPEGTRAGALDAMQKLRTPSASTGPLNDALLASVKEMESFIPRAYPDHKQVSVGYGTRAKHPGEVLSQSQADQRLRDELTMHAGNVDKAAAEAGIKLTPGQRNALISFDFNTGKGAFLIESSGGDIEDIKRRMPLYNKASGSTNKGLVNRRKKELAIFES
jgi:GH24 family phage-related lysozyme (muramidase)